MGLDIGIMELRILDRPHDAAYEFAKELAVEGASDFYMWGAGSGYAAFTQRQVLRMLDEFTRRRSLTPAERGEVREWIQSLPWDGWQDALPPDNRLNPAYGDPVGDDDDDDDDGRHEGGFIELYFNW